MDIFCFCLEIIKREAERFNAGIQASTASQLTAANANDINYDNAHNRCAFLYRCGAISLSLARDCFRKFLSECNGIQYLMSKWRFDSYLTFCSLSKGPALDYIALLLSHEQCAVLTSLIGNIRIIAKHGAWRNSANIMLELINNGYFKNLPPSVGNMEVIQGDPFNNFNEKVKLPIKDSDVVMMMKALNLQSDGYDKTKIYKYLQEFLEALKPGAVLFCIDTKPSIKEITQLLMAFDGKYLLEPTNMNTVVNLEYTHLYKTQFGCLPVVSGRGCFFVWEKSSVSSAIMKHEFPELVKHSITDKNCDKVVADEYKLKFSSKTQLSRSLETCDQESSKSFNSHNMPKSDEKNNAVNIFDFETGDPLLAEDGCFKKSNYLLPSSSLLNQSISKSDSFKNEDYIGLNAVKSQLNLISKGICMQTEAEFPEIAKVTELTNKITDITEEISKLLENNTSKYCANDNCSRNSDEIDNFSDIKNHSSEISPQNFKTCCCHNHSCHKLCLSSNHDCGAPLYEESSNYCRLGSNRLISLVENAPSAQLVIPLNNLSTNVISQIISLITQSNHESEIK